MNQEEYSFGAADSSKDIRTFTYAPYPAHMTGGTRYEPKDIEHQHKVGICTAISFTQNARKARGIAYSADFQYLLQKLEVDGNWDEGSSISSALKVGSKFGLLPVQFFDKWMKESDRKQPYFKYIEKLKKVPKAEIEKLKEIAAAHKIIAYAKIPIDRDMLANAIDESEAGILVRFAVGKEWYTKPIEPLRPPKEVISGHAITESNYDGNSFRVANTWGTMWADKGTAYHLLRNYAPTEAWMVYFDRTTPKIESDLEKKERLMGQLKDKLQELLEKLRTQ